MRRWDRGRNVDRGPGTSSVETTTYECSVDPIRYAWERRAAPRRAAQAGLHLSMIEIDLIKIMRFPQKTNGTSLRWAGVVCWECPHLRDI
jgi:hypothetical protein